MITALKWKIVEFRNRVDLDEVAHNEPPLLSLHCLLSNLWILIWLGQNVEILQAYILPAALLVLIYQSSRSG